MIKSILNDSRKPKVYPYLGINIRGDIVVLFTAPGYGIVVHSEDSSVWKIGDYHGDWSEADSFLEYTGTIILSNDSSYN